MTIAVISSASYGLVDNAGYTRVPLEAGSGRNRDREVEVERE